MEPGLTTFGAINALFDQLGKPPMTRDEAVLAVETVAAEYRAVEAQTQATFAESQHAASQMTQSLSFTQSQLPPPGGAEGTAAATAQDVKEAPLLHTVKLLLESRGLKMEVLSKRELQDKHCRIAAADLIPGRRVAMLFDKQRGAMAGVFLDAKVVRHSVRNSMHLIVPVAEPCPWRRRVFGVSAIDAFHCIATFVYHAELDTEAQRNEDGDDEIAAEESSAQHRHQRTTKRAETASDSTSSAVSETSSSEWDEMASTRGSSSSDDDSENSRRRRRRKRIDAGQQQRAVVVAAPPVLPRRFGRMLTLQPNLLPKVQKQDNGKHADNVVDGGMMEANVDDEKSKRKRSREPSELVPATPSHSSSNDEVDDDPTMRVANFSLQPSATNEILSNDEIADEDRSVAVDAALKQRRVITWLEHPDYESRVRESTAINISRQVENLKDEAARSLQEFGFSCERLGPTGIIKLKFMPPTSMSSTAAANNTQNDPFTEVPTVAIASKYRERKHVKHSWTQRLVETERRGKLYNNTR
ncbi:Hypothetical protein, putative [Bodo saltans]|uniref:Uncharacterized protein n=1 Tax=Bodo saltans TaxID=75058 RepID=A0A0S4JK68_BODSA|nr:Hypothetical protein, putative [Bodo saltans]|eukprot:CUG89581.1 Hypothetical protein, putative [Bodo saltans]